MAKPELRKNVLLLANVPSPYLSPVYERLKASADWNLTVCYVSVWNIGVGWAPASAIDYTTSTDVILIAQRSRIVPWLSDQTTATLALLRLLAKEPADYFLIYGYTRLPQLFLIGWALLLNIPFAIAGDANYYTDRAQGWRRAVKTWWLRLLARRAAALIVVGRASRMFWETYGAPARRLFHAGFAVDNDYFRAESVRQKDYAAQLRRQFGWEKHTVFLYVGRLIERKNIHQLIAAAQQINDLPVALLIAGDGEERAALEALADGHQRVRFVGSLTQAELPLYYALSDVLVLPARAEPWGLVINEAMASGLAVIAHQHCGATPDLVAADNGAVLQGFSVEELADALRSLAQDAATLLRFKQRSQEKIRGWSIPQAALGLKQAIDATSNKGGIK